MAYSPFQASVHFHTHENIRAPEVLFMFSGGMKWIIDLNEMS